MINPKRKLGHKLNSKIESLSNEQLKSVLHELKPDCGIMIPHIFYCWRDKPKIPFRLKFYISVFGLKVKKIDSLEVSMARFHKNGTMTTESYQYIIYDGDYPVNYVKNLLKSRGFTELSDSDKVKLL